MYSRLISGVLTVTLLALIVGLLFCPREAEARPPSCRPTPWRWCAVESTWYGPGFYWHGFACADGRGPLPERYSPRVRGVAHRTLPCGAKVTLRRNGRVVHVRVIDRGPYSGATFDLTARTAQDLCDCTKPYTMRHRWTRGWATTPTYRSTT